MSATNENIEDDSRQTPATPPVTHEPPDWAKRLQQTLEELPGKLKATVTDEDRSGIAEAVHGLFEKSGAFHTPEETEREAEQESETATRETENTSTEPPPKKGGFLSGFAARFEGK